MKAQTVIKHLKQFCDIKHFVIGTYDDYISLLLTWKGGKVEFCFTYGLDGLTKFDVLHLLTKQLDSKPKVSNADRLFFFKYLTRRQQTYLYKMEPEFYGKVYKYAK